MTMPACMMNKVIGFLVSYLDGSAPSKTPPCGGARRVVLGEGVALTVLVMNSVTVAVAMIDGSQENEHSKQSPGYLEAIWIRQTFQEKGCMRRARVSC